MWQKALRPVRPSPGQGPALPRGDWPGLKLPDWHDDYRNEDWLQVALLDERDQIRFTSEFQRLLGELGWEVRAFVGHLLGTFNMFLLSREIK
jgi:hypothetical protein